MANASGSFGLDDRCSSFYMGVFSIDETRKSQRFLLVRFFIGKENAVFLHRLFCIDLFQLPIISFVLTRWNNRNLYRKVNKSFEYEDEELKKRQELLEEMYTERFGTKEERETVRFYSVSEEKNLDTTLIADLYKENGVELK